MVKVIYNFIKSYQTSRVAVSSMFHHDIISLSVSLLLFGTVDIFFFNHSDRCVVLISISLMLMMLSAFLCAQLPSTYLLLKNIYSILLPIFKLCYFLTVECRQFVIYSGCNAFVRYRFVNIFPNLACLFILFKVSFAEPKFLILMKYYLAIFSLMGCHFGVKHA